MCRGFGRRSCKFSAALPLNKVSVGNHRHSSLIPHVALINEILKSISSNLVLLQHLKDHLANPRNAGEMANAMLLPKNQIQFVGDRFIFRCLVARIESKRFDFLALAVRRRCLWSA